MPRNHAISEKFISVKHSKLVLEQINAFVATQKLTDVTIIAPDDSCIHAHRLVLSSASDYFRAMFTSGLREAQMAEVKIQSTDPAALKALVVFCYTGEIDLTETNVEATLQTANLLQMLEVVNACSNFLICRLTMNNAIGFWLFGEAQGCIGLERSAYKFIMDNFSDVYLTEEFLKIPAKEIRKFFADDMLNVSVEYECFEALTLWVIIDAPRRIKEVPSILSLIRLPHIPKYVLMDQVEVSKFTRDTVASYKLVMEAMKYHLFPERHYQFHSPRSRPRKSTVGTLLAIGGMDGGKGSANIDAYNFRLNVWTRYNRMPSNRLQFGAAVLNDKLYVVGGRDELKTLNIVECYDFDHREWSGLPPMSTNRHGLGVAVLGGQLYAVGGHDGWTYLNTVERWDPSSRQWSFISPMNQQRSTAGVAVLNGRLFAVGGRDGSQCLKTVECFDPYRNKWVFCAPMSVKRGGVGVGVIKGYLYALGGHDAPVVNPGGSRFNSVERYDPRTNHWTMIASMSMGRDAMGVTLLGDLLLSIGGYDGQSYLKLAEAYDPVKNKWEKLKELDEGRAGMCIVVENNVPPWGRKQTPPLFASSLM